MKVEVESTNPTITKSISDRLISEVSQALKSVTTDGGEFVVNDTLWFWKNPAGAVRPTVVNSAGYISKNFQNGLEKLGWEKEPTINGQNFDALSRFEATSNCYQLKEEHFLTLLKNLRDGGFSDYGLEATSIYRQYVQSSAPFLPAALMPFSSQFHVELRDYEFRVGLEFETGNIASSFRAIEKLQGLYDAGHLDIGIFVTSKSKSDGAARIWPVSNRNGSFEELRHRRYDARRSYPHIDISFRPDRYDQNARYIADTHLYEMVFTGVEFEDNGVRYRVAANSKGEQKLLPEQSTTLL